MRRKPRVKSAKGMKNSAAESACNMKFCRKSRQSRFSER